MLIKLLPVNTKRFKIIGNAKALNNSGKAKIAGEGGKTVEVGAFDEKKWTGLKRANMGFKVGVGAEYNKLYLEVGYQLGVTDISKNGNNEAINGKVGDISIKSNAFFMNFGVNF